MKPRVEAQQDVLAAMPRLPAVHVPLDLAKGLVLAEPVVAPHDVPPFPNSAMDGYAVRADDITTVPATLRVVDELAAGSVSQVIVEPGTAVEIMTGAPMPAGADTVVEVEVTSRDGDRVTIGETRQVGANVRPAGGDMRAGDLVFEAGERLSAVHLGVLASLGVVEPYVSTRPVVAVVSTGDELLPPNSPVPPPGKIRDANRASLIGLLGDLGVDTIDGGIVGDDEDALRATLLELAMRADVVVTSGGVSMGVFDYVKQVLADLGEIAFWKVAMQPGKPFAFGRIGDTPLFGLPGNPVSSVVSFEQFVRPALLQMMGARTVFRPRTWAVMGERVKTNPAKDVFLRVQTRMEDGLTVAVRSGGQSSNVLSALAHADALAIVPVGTGVVEPGDPVMLELFRCEGSR